MSETSELSSPQLTTLVYLTTRDCPICGPTERELDRLLQAWRPRVHFIRIDADDHPEIARALDIRAVPAILVFAPGSRVQTLLGFHSMEQLHKRLLNITSTVDGE